MVVKAFQKLIRGGVKQAGGDVISTTSALNKNLPNVVSGGRTFLARFGRGAGKTIAGTGGKVAGLGVVIGGAGVGASALVQNLKRNFGTTGAQIQKEKDIELFEAETGAIKERQELFAQTGGTTGGQFAPSIDTGQEDGGLSPLLLLPLLLIPVLFLRKKKKRK